MKEAYLYKKLPDEKVQCQACSHYCNIAKGKTGICGVRKNIKGKLYLLVYGKSVTLNIDPIEKKPLYHFMPGSYVLSFGTVGCNFRCDFCQNWDISQAHKKGGWEELGQDLPPEKIVEIALEHDVPSVSYTYNEPAIFHEYAYDTCKLGREKGIKNIYVTNGYESAESMEKIVPLLDAANVDIKSMEDGFYRSFCGGKLKPVLENIKRFYEHGIHLELTTLMIPGKNDNQKNMRDIAKFISDIDKEIPWHISRFFPAYQMTDVAPTPRKTLEKARKIGKDEGLKNIYLGNI